MELKGIVFDMDHTLYDREASNLYAMESYYNEERSRFKKNVTLQEAQRAMLRADRLGCHFSWMKMLEYLDEADIFATLPDYSDICDRFQVFYGEGAVIYKETIPSLLKLRDMGLKTGLITNGSEKSQWPKIRHLEIEKCFDAIIIGSDPETRKPHREIFDRMADMLGLDNENLIYVGDHPAFDVDGSRNAGYTPVWIRNMPWDWPEVERPEYEIDRIEEIVPLAKALLSL